MKRSLLLLVFSLAYVTAGPSRIVGGSVTTINNYPQTVSLLQRRASDNLYWQSCGGIIINTRNILTAAHCTFGYAPIDWRARVGSTWANSGGVVHSFATIINHPNYNPLVGFDSDIAVVRTSSVITYINNAVQSGTFAGANYQLADNAVVWAAGWGFTSETGPPSEQLRHVQVWTVNQAECRSRYGWNSVTDNMLCAGWLNVGGRDSCNQDSGGPLFQNNIVVGLSSFGSGCGRPNFPGVYTRVSRFIGWIQANS